MRCNAGVTKTKKKSSKSVTICAKNALFILFILVIYQKISGILCGSSALSGNE